MPSDSTLSPPRGFTVRELAQRYRVSAERVLSWIRRGELAAINRRDVRCGRPAYVVTPEALAEFERRRQEATPDAPRPKRKQRTNVIDFYPD